MADEADPKAICTVCGKTRAACRQALTLNVSTGTFNWWLDRRMY